MSGRKTVRKTVKKTVKLTDDPNFKKTTKEQMWTMMEDMKKQMDELKKNQIQTTEAPKTVVVENIDERQQRKSRKRKSEIVIEEIEENEPSTKKGKKSLETAKQRVSDDNDNDCDGDGICLQQSSDDPNVYILDPNCIHHCQPVPCPNFQFCGSKNPQWLLDSHGGYCLTCNMSVGRRKIQPSSIGSCPVCFENVQLFDLVQCSHKLCKKCYKQFLFPNNDDKNEDFWENRPAYFDRCPLCRASIHGTEPWFQKK